MKIRINHILSIVLSLFIGQSAYAIDEYQALVEKGRQLLQETIHNNQKNDLFGRSDLNTYVINITRSY